MSRIFFDVSFTRTQHTNVGITRTVRRLCEEFARLGPVRGLACMPVGYHSGGFRALPIAALPANSVMSPPPNTQSGVIDWITTGPIRQMVSEHFPLPLRRLAWLVYSWWDFNRLARNLPRIQAAPGDVLFLSDASWNYSVWRTARQARRCGASVVTVVYDLIPVRQPQFCPALTTIAFRKWLVRLMPCSDGVLCISQSVEQDLRAYALENAIDLPQTKSFRLGCDPIVETAVGEHVRPAIHSFFEGSACFTAIGSVEPRKNYGFMLDVFDRLWTRDAPVRLMVVGRRTTQSAEVLERLDRHPELGRRLMFISDGTDDEVAFTYAHSRALLFPSLAEGFGLPLVEARARGCRVIATALPAFAELADEGVSLFPPGAADVLEEQILLHLEEPSTVDRVVPFTWSDSAASCLAFIESVRMGSAVAAARRTNA